MSGVRLSAELGARMRGKTMTTTPDLIDFRQYLDAAETPTQLSVRLRTEAMRRGMMELVIVADCLDGMFQGDKHRAARTMKIHEVGT